MFYGKEALIGKIIMDKLQKNKATKPQTNKQTTSDVAVFINILLLPLQAMQGDTLKCGTQEGCI